MYLHIFETSRYKAPTRFDTSTPYLGERQTTSELGSSVYQTPRQTSPSDGNWGYASPIFADLKFP
jgi:hypothetical protein